MFEKELGSAQVLVNTAARFIFVDATSEDWNAIASVNINSKKIK